MINVFQPCVGQAELAAVQRVFASNWLGKGDECAAFEVEFAGYLGVDPNHLLLFNSCTSALYVGLRALGVFPGDEVIIPTIHFVGVANAVIQLGARPVFADVDPHTLNVLPSEVARLKSRDTKAIIILHYGGLPCDVDAIRQACGDGVFIVEDAAGAIASRYNGKPCGTLGDMGVWSFDAMKTITMGDGGALWMKDVYSAEQTKSLRYLGMDVESGRTVVGQHSHRWWEFDVGVPSLRYISNDIAAAIGRVQLGRLGEFVTRRAEIAGIYDRELAEFVTLPPTGGYPNGTHYLYWIQTPDRDQLAAYLFERGIYTTFRYYPLHLIMGQARLPEAEWAASHTLNLPIHPTLTDDDVHTICDAIKEFYRGR